MNTPITLRKLISEENCYETLRQLRWPEGVSCPVCGSVEVNRRGYDEVHRSGQRYQCKGCDRRFDDLSETVLAGHHQPLPVWIVCLYFMGLNLSNRQIAQALDLNEDDVQGMTTALREGVDKAPRRSRGRSSVMRCIASLATRAIQTPSEPRGAWDGADGSRASGGAAPWRKTSRRCSA